MLPHAGDATARSSGRSPRWAGRCETLAPVAGARRLPARAAILFDWESWWASELDSHPTSRLRYRQEALDWYSAFLAVGVRADVLPVAADFSTGTTWWSRRCCTWCRPRWPRG